MGRKGHWLHEGAFYGKNGGYVGTYYNNDSGWYASPYPGNTPVKAKSRRDAIRLIEAAETLTAAPPETGK